MLLVKIRLSPFMDASKFNDECRMMNDEKEK
jgi:hypothetical protein